MSYAGPIACAAQERPAPVAFVWLDLRERWILDHAENYVACAFRGRGRYERVACATVDEARAWRRSGW